MIKVMNYTGCSAIQPWCFDTKRHQFSASKNNEKMNSAYFRVDYDYSPILFVDNKFGLNFQIKFDPQATKMGNRIKTGTGSMLMPSSEEENELILLISLVQKIDKGKLLSGKSGISLEEASLGVLRTGMFVAGLRAIFAVIRLNDPRGYISVKTTEQHCTDDNVVVVSWGGYQRMSPQKFEEWEWNRFSEEMNPIGKFLSGVDSERRSFLKMVEAQKNANPFTTLKSLQDIKK